MRHAPALRHAAHEHIGQRHDSHALVVGHVSADQREFLAMGLAFGREVQRLVKAVAAARRQCSQRAKVVAGRTCVHQCGQRRGIRGNHQLAHGREAQCQSGHTLRGILVCQRVIAPGIGAFGNAPGHVLVEALHIRHMFTQGRTPCLAQGTVEGLGDHQGGHEVLEHRTRPRAQYRVVAVGKKRPAQCRPVTHGQIALSHGHQAGGPGFGGQQVVERGVELRLFQPVADVQQMPPGVVQKPEVGLPGERIQRLGQGHEAPRGLGCAAAVCGLRVAVHRLQRSQMVGQQPQQFVVGRGPGVHDGSVPWLGHTLQLFLRLRQQRAKRRGLGLVRRVGWCHAQQAAQRRLVLQAPHAVVQRTQPGLQPGQRGADGLLARLRR